MIRIICIALLLGLLPKSLAAQWEIAVKNLLRDTYNTLVYVKYNGAGLENREMLMTLGFRHRNEHNFILSREVKLRVRSGQTYPLRFSVPQGDYVVSVDIQDTETGMYTYLEEVFSSTVSRDRFSVSDIFLSYSQNKDSALLQPILRPVLPPGKKLYFFLEVYDRDYREVPVRAYLLKEKTATESLSATTYDSRKYTNKVLYVFKDKDRRADFADFFTLEDLDAGEYLIQILVYDDEQYLDEKSTRFVIEGKTKQMIYGDLDTSIRMMKYILSPQEIDSLLKIEDPLLKRERFDREWRNQYAEEAESQMEIYFKKIYAANTRFTEDRPGWETDRGKIFVQYGEPGQDKAGVEIAGKSYRRWTYPKWSLTFLFEKRNQRYVLVE
jgi:GWxTD domain-containing protein